MGNLCKSVFPNTDAWELPETKIKKQMKKRGVSMERSKAGMKKRSPNRLSQPNQNTIINIICYFI